MDLTASAIMGTFCGTTTALRPQQGSRGNSGAHLCGQLPDMVFLVDSDGGYPYTNSTDRKMEFYYGGTPAEGRRYEKEDAEYFIMLGEPKWRWRPASPQNHRGSTSP